MRLILATVLAFAATSANAEFFDLVGKNDPNNKAHVEFNYSGLTTVTGRVDVSVTNTSTRNGVGGVLNPAPHLSAIAFNLPSQIFSLLSYTLPTGWAAYPTSPILGLLPALPDNTVTPPSNVGAFDMCAETQGANRNCSGGGPNAPKLSVGETGAFSFVFTGLNMMGLNTMSFLNLLSNPTNNNSTPGYFAARFQATGPTGAGSDVALPGGPPTGPPSDVPTSPVPEPTSVVLVTIGAAIMFFRHRALAAR